MINNQYQLFRESIFNLAETIVIKFSNCADAVNLGVVENYGIASVDFDNPYSWKYYQNIAGNYHITDKVMTVPSLDVAQRIIFNKENLITHLATKQAYAYGSRYYQELVLQYPEQEMLILGILYPVDITKAIQAKDGTILTYPPELVEQYETSLIPKLQNWINNYLFRWFNRQFTLTDDLYFATSFGQLCALLIPAITNIRKAACHTDEVHSFHLQQYLASHGRLDRYLPYLTREQALFLYRNINYLQRYAGKRDTFDTLVARILTKRGFPLYRYQAVHATSDMHNESFNNPANFLPEPRFLRKGVNALGQATVVESFSFNDVLAKIEPIAIGNPKYQRDNKEHTSKQLAYSPSAVVQTKLLESISTDYSSVVPYTIEAIAMQHWLNQVAKEEYVATVVVRVPHNTEAYRLNAQDAVAMFLYCTIQAANVRRVNDVLVWNPPVRVPRIRTNKVMRNPKPSFAELRGIVDAKRIPNSLINALLDTSVEHGRIASIDAFYEYCVKVLAASNLQYRYSTIQEHFIARSEVELLTERLYAQEIVSCSLLQDPVEVDANNIPLGILYTDWIESIGVEFSDFTPTDYFDLALSIYKEATGVGVKTPTRLGEVQKALTQLFMELSSYSIVLIPNSSVEDLIPLGFHGVQLGDQRVDALITTHLNAAPVTILEVNTSVENKESLNLESLIFDSHVSAYHRFRLDGGVELKINNSGSYLRHLNLAMDYRTDAPQPSSYDSYPLAQQADFVDAYGYDGENHTHVVNFPINGFTLMPDQREITPIRLWSGNSTIPDFTLVNKVKQLVWLSYTKPVKSLNGISVTKPYKDIIDTVYVNPSKSINAFKLTPGYVTVSESFRIITNTKTLKPSAYVKPFKDIDINITRAIKHLNAFSLTRVKKNLDGFSMGTNGSSDVVI